MKNAAILLTLLAWLSAGAWAGRIDDGTEGRP